MSIARSSRMLKYVNYRMRITLKDSRTLVGVFLAFDRHMNMVLSDTEEFRRIKGKKGGGVKLEKHEKRALGLVILRGDNIVSMTVEGPPPADDTIRKTPGGPGKASNTIRGNIPTNTNTSGMNAPPGMSMPNMPGMMPSMPMPGMQSMPGMPPGMSGMPPGMPGMPPGMPGMMMPPQGMPGMMMPPQGMPGMPPIGMPPGPPPGPPSGPPPRPLPDQK